MQLRMFSASTMIECMTSCMNNLMTILAAAVQLSHACMQIEAIELIRDTYAAAKIVIRLLMDDVMHSSLKQKTISCS